MQLRRKLLCGASALALGVAALSLAVPVPAPQQAQQPPTTKPAEKLPPLVFHSHNPDCEITIDISDAPYLREWVETKLGPTLAEWYPKISEMIPSEGYTPPTKFLVTFPLRSG